MSAFKGKMSLIEKVDLKALQTIVDNFPEVFERMGKRLKVQSKDNPVLYRQITDLRQAETLMKDFYLSKKKSPVVTYKYIGKLDYGRRFHCSPSLQECPRPIRHAISKDIYYDLDIKNAHPVFLYQLCETMDFPHPVLKAYVKGDREGFLQSMFGIKFDRKVEESDDTITMEEVTISSRDEAKALFLSILNGGGSGKTGNELLDDFYKQQQIFLKTFYESPEFSKYKLRAEKVYKAGKRPWDNRKGSALNYYLCEIEDNVLTHMEEFLQSQNVSYGTLCFDGLMVYRKDVKDLPLLLESMSDFVKDKMGYPITITSKEMEEDVDLDGLRPNDEEKQDELPESEFPEIEWAEDLEYNHSRVMNYCFTFEKFCVNIHNLKTLQKRIYEYMDHFFATIEGNQQFPLRMVFHIVNGRRVRKNFIRMRDSWKAYCADKTIISQKTRGDNGKPVVLFMMESYLSYFNRKKYSRFGYVPSTKEQPFFNTFTGFTYLDDGKELEMEKIRPFLDHVRKVICRNDEKCYLHFIKHIARLLQRPEIRSRIAVVIRSDGEGAGKGIILSLIGSLMGIYDQDTGAMGCFREIHDMEKIFGRFNGMLEGAQVIWCDEAFWAGDKKAYGKLLGLITEDTITIENKGYEPYVCQNYVNLFMTSNSDWVAPASAKSRRFFVLDADNVYSGVANKESIEYFTKIAKTDKQTLANFFYRLDISDFDPTLIPQTEALFQQKKLSMTSPVEWAMNLLGDDLTWNDYVEGVRKEDVYDHYTNWCSRTKAYKTEPANVFWKHLKNIFGETSKRVLRSGDRYWVAIFPAHDKAMEQFCEAYKMELSDLKRELGFEEPEGPDQREEDELVIELESEGPDQSEEDDELVIEL